MGVIAVDENENSLYEVPRLVDQVQIAEELVREQLHAGAGRRVAGLLQLLLRFVVRHGVGRRSARRPHRAGRLFGALAPHIAAGQIEARRWRRRLRRLRRRRRQCRFGDLGVRGMLAAEQRRRGRVAL